MLVTAGTVGPPRCTAARHSSRAAALNRVLPDRVDPYAKALENRGIRATYELHDRVLSNRRSRELFAQRDAELDDVQQRIVDDVERQGFSLATFADLFPEQEQLGCAGDDARPVRRRDGVRAREGRGPRPRPRREGVRRAAPQLRRRAGPRRSRGSRRAHPDACSTSRTRTCA